MKFWEVTSRNHTPENRLVPGTKPRKIGLFKGPKLEKRLVPGTKPRKIGLFKGPKLENRSVPGT